MEPVHFQRFLDELARLGRRHGCEIVGAFVIRPIDDDHGGYVADGARVKSYRHGESPGPGMVGEDAHPLAREKRQREWMEENREAIESERNLNFLRNAFPLISPAGTENADN